ncbi:hypothetical protein A2U01_0112797, partial [Trifolium medium]|nr:hypothetical protein [Trifolium medium]
MYMLVVQRSHAEATSRPTLPLAVILFELFGVPGTGKLFPVQGFEV